MLHVAMQKKKITRECFLGDQSVETNECAKEYSTDSENEKYEPCFHLPKCSMGSWKNIGKCSKSCGGGKQAQERECNGNYCGSQGTIQMIDCNTEKCPSIWSSWGQFGPCSVTCGTGQKTRSRFGIEGDIKGEIETNSEYCHPGSCYCYVSRARNDGSAGCGTYHADCRCSNGRSTQVGQPIYDHGIFGSDCRASGPSTKIRCEKWCGETCRNL